MKDRRVVRYLCEGSDSRRGPEGKRRQRVSGVERSVVYAAVATGAGAGGSGGQEKGLVGQVVSPQLG